MTKWIATAQFILLAPAIVFMSALVIRYVYPDAQRLVLSYGPVGLWGFLMTLPLVAWMLGCLSLVRTRTVAVGVPTGIASAILVIVFLHMMAN